LKRLLVALLALAITSNAYGGSLPAFGGSPRPLGLRDLDGEQIRIEQFRGRIVVVNFWATWCPPCRAEMPSLWRLQQAIGTRQLVVLAVNIGESGEIVRAFLPEAMVRDFHVLLDRKGVAAGNWRVSAYPTTFIIDTDGRFRYRKAGALEWDSAPIQEQIRTLLLPKNPR
jgi:thiol-disulfide isomerase/thioredoxin